MGKAWSAVLAAALVVATVGCSKQEPKAGAAVKAGLTADGKGKGVASAPAAGHGPVYVDAVKFSVLNGAGGQEVRYEGLLHNDSDAPVEGVELNISLVNADGAGVGGQATQSFFQPSVPPKGTQNLLVQLPALKVKGDLTALVAQISVSKVLDAQAPTAPPAPPPVSTATPVAIAGGPNAPAVEASSPSSNGSATATTAKEPAQ